MKILMIGSGGREHALIKKIKESPLCSEILCTPGNGGIARDAKCFDVAVTDFNGILSICRTEAVDLVFVAPEDPLALGLVDLLTANGIKAFGPTQTAAQLESSKVFSKNLMKKYNIPTALYEVFDDAEKALLYIKTQNKYPIFIKTDGLAQGKGAVFAGDYCEAENVINSIMCDKVFGASGDKIVVEECMTGPEVSVLAFVDGKTIVPMVSAMDHKRIFDGDMGPNTGGMGTISPNPFYTDEIADRCMEEIYKPTVAALNSESIEFKGCIFFGLMLTKGGPKVIEYNCRFGDPETQVVLPRLKIDIVEIILAVINGTLDKINIEWDEKACSCIILASGGYPGSYPKGLPITGTDGMENVIHAGTAIKDGSLVTNGGRVLGVTGTGKTIDEALNYAYADVKKISFEKMQYRKDIGKTKSI